MTVLTEIDGTPVNEVDAGIKAADRIRNHHATLVAIKAVKRTIALLLVAMTLALSGTAYYGYSTRVTGYLTDSRQCNVSIGDSEVTGTRTYSYPFQEYFGYRFIDTKSIEEQTKINISGNPLQIIGLNKDDHWVLNIGMGEKYNQLLKPADTYVFSMGKAAAPVDYKSFCK